MPKKQTAVRLQAALHANAKAVAESECSTVTGYLTGLIVADLKRRGIDPTVFREDPPDQGNDPAPHQGGRAESVRTPVHYSNPRQPRKTEE